MAQYIDWGSLGFGYVPTPYNVRCTYTNKAWGELRVCDTPEITLHISSAVLHYAQECFEGMKAFRGKDGKVRIFRIEDGGRRMQDSCRGIQMPELPLEKFIKAIKKVVELNADFIPPYGTGASLYIRPVLFATTPLVGVKPADDYEFVVFVTPVGPYFKGGFKSTPFMLSRKYDRAAPLGTGNIKVGGNYAASMTATVESTIWATLTYSTLIQKKNVISTNVAQLTSSLSKEMLTSLHVHALSSLQSQTAV